VVTPSWECNCIASRYGVCFSSSFPVPLEPLGAFVSRFISLVFLLFALLFGLDAFATTSSIDVSAAVSTISGDATAAVSSVGAAMLGLAGVAIGFKWAKAAFFG
jgi:hypothetical protein